MAAPFSKLKSQNILGQWRLFWILDVYIDNTYSLLQYLEMDKKNQLLLLWSLCTV